MNKQVEFNDLPVEMKEYILNNLDHTTKKAARLVSSEWKSIVERKMVFEIVLTDGTYEAFKKFDDDKPIRKLVVRSFLKPIVTKSSTRSGLQKNVENLRIGHDAEFPGDFRRDPENPYNLWRIILNGKNCPDNDVGICPENLKALLELNSEIKSLSVSGTALNYWKECMLLNRVQWNSLTTLDIHFGSFPTFGPLERNYVDPYVKLLKKHFPSLHTLRYSSTSWKAEFRLFVAVLQCVAAHKKSIKTLKVFHTTVYTLTNCVEEGGWFPVERFNKLAKDLCEVRLEYLLLDLMKCGPNVGGRWRQLERNFLESQDQLSTLRLICSARETLDVNHGLIFQSVSSTLSRLTLWLNCLHQIPFDCSVLQQCSRLKSLTLNVSKSGIFIEQPFMMMYNLHKLPTSLTDLLCGQMVADQDCDWICKNLHDLESITYNGLRYDFETAKTLEHFLMYLDLPKLTIFRVNNFKCQRILRFVHQTPGMEINPENPGIEVIIDRNIFDPTTSFCIVI